MGTKTDDIMIAIRGDIKNLDASLVAAQKKIDYLVKHTRKASRQMENPIMKIGSLVKGYIGLQAGQYMLKLVGDIDSVKDSFNALSRDVEGGSKKLLADIKTASKGTVSELEIMRSSNLAITLMGKEVTDHLPKMMEVARVAARTQGQSVQQMYNDIIVASGRQSVMILDNLGISSATAARYQEEYAKKLGKTRQQLNATEKRAGFFYAVMKAGNDLMDMAGGKTLTMGERLQIVKAKATNAAASFTEKLIPGMEEFTSLITEVDDKTSKSFMQKFGEVVSDVILVFTQLGNLIKSFPALVDQAMKDAGDFLAGGSRRAAVQYRKHIERQVANMANLSPAVAMKFIKKNEDGLLKAGFSEDYLKAAYRMTRTQSKYSLYNQGKRGSGSGYQKPGVGGSGSGAGAGKGLSGADVSKFNKFMDTSDMPTKVAAPFYQDTGNKEQAELQELELHYQQLREKYSNHQEQLIQLQTVYNERKENIEQRYSEGIRFLHDTIGVSSKKALATFDTATREALHNSLWGKGGWKEWGKAVKEMLKQLITDLIYAVTKALILKAIVGSMGGGGGLLGMIFRAGKVPVYERGHVPVYEKGHIPVFSSGFIPHDHYPAFIGHSEAVMNAGATRQNADILREMNRTGKRMDRNITVPVTVSIGNEEVYRRSEQYRIDQAKRMGTTSFPQPDVYGRG